MKLIPTGEALTFLSQAAPRAWVDRFLRWMAFNDGLTVYANEGRVQPYCMIGEFYVRHRETVGEYSGEKMDAYIRENYDDDIANRIAGKGSHERFDDEIYSWGDENEIVIVDPGFFIFSEEIDWAVGKLKASAVTGYGEAFELFFNDQAEHLLTSLDRASFDAEMSKLQFEFSEIEMLLPNATLQHSFAFPSQSNVRQTPIGRPARWDWEGAIVSVVAEAQKPDGLPTGHGAQARIEELIAAWFTNQSGDCPAPSQVRQRAAKIMRTLKRPEMPEI